MPRVVVSPSNALSAPPPRRTSQFKVPLDGAKAKVVGMATTPDNAVHVLTAHPANLYTFRGPTFDGPVQVTAMDFLPALQSGITTVPGTGELLIHSLPAGVIYKVCPHNQPTWVSTLRARLILGCAELRWIRLPWTRV